LASFREIFGSGEGLGVGKAARLDNLAGKKRRQVKNVPLKKAGVEIFATGRQSRSTGILSLE